MSFPTFPIPPGDLREDVERLEGLVFEVDRETGVVSVWDSKGEPVAVLTRESLRELDLYGLTRRVLSPLIGGHSDGER